MINEQFSIIWGTRLIRSQQIKLYLASAVKLLKGLGIKSGDCVAICADTSVEYVILLLALWQSKAVAAPISPRWPDKTITAYTAKINAVKLFKSPDIKRIVCFDARQQMEAAGLKPLELDQEATIVATSGSSGEAKAALHTWGNHFYNAKGSNELIPLSSQDRWLLSLPLYHVSGLGVLSRCLLSGAGLVVAGDQDLAAVIEKGKVTHVSLVATQLQRLLANPANHAVLAMLKCILLGGSAIPRTVIEESVQLGLKIYVSYGLTETASQVATGRVVDPGKPCAVILQYRELKISEQGEILVKGEVLFKGYVSGGKLSRPLHDGWFATGDMGKLDAEGHLTVTGRRDSMFISGGENIHPEEIEKALLGIKGIAEALVVAREDREFGHRPVAFIKYAGQPLKEEDIIAALKNSLPHFKIPIAFLSWPQGLISQGIKISRQEFLKSISRR